jgi:peptidoglycan/xylan/chitin deacetylase (PgdA/CDA1 family)
MSAKHNSEPLILMYHGIVHDASSLPPNRELGADLYDVSVRNFEDQMNWLKAHLFEPAKCEDSTPPDSKKIILTFDDGEMNNYTHALALLRELRFPAYFFVIGKRVGKPGYLGWPELRQLIDAGMVIGSHGLSHEILTNLADTQVEEELRASRKFLMNNLGTNIDALSIPRGFCNDKIIQIAYAVGYKNVFISERPNNLRMRCLSRLAVKGNWTLKRFEQAVTGNIPLPEKILDGIKKASKKVLRGGLYNQVRNLLIRIIQ